jgi:hypothetical protein
VKSKQRRRRRTAATPKLLSVKEDPNNNPDPDDQHGKKLVDALASGPVALGDLRRQSGLEPTLVGRLIQKFSVFKSFDQVGKPFVKLTTDPVSAMLSFGHKQAGPKGTSAAPFEDIDAATEANAAGTNSSTLADAKNRLVGVLQFARYTPFLEDVGFPLELIRAINVAYPDLVTISPCELGQEFAFRVSLIDSEKVTAATPPLRSRRIPQTPPVSTMTDEDRARLTWRPASRGSANRRERRPVAGLGRARNPLISL